MKRFLLVAFFFSSAASAATFLVPDDRALVDASRAIVVATAGASHARWSPGGWIETVTTLRVDEVVKGRVDGAIDVTELGGAVGATAYVVPGAPRYAAGERVLLFLETNDRGEWVAKNMALGKFAFRSDVAGRRLLVREDLSGWDYDGQPHHEPLRSEQEFLDFVRASARGEAAPQNYIIRNAMPIATESIAANASSVAPSTYLMQQSGSSGTLGIRWPSFPTPVSFYSHGSQPGATGGGLTSIQRALAAWTNDPGSNIVYQYAGTTTIARTGFGGAGSDGVNTIQFNDPAQEIPGSYTGMGGDTLAVGGAWIDTSKTNSANGEQYYTITEADLVVQDGITGPGLTGNGFDHVLTHELGHTLGLRHSDQPPAGGTSSSTAIMNSSVAFDSDPYGSTLQAWDIAAIDAVYGSGSSSGGSPPPGTGGGTIPPPGTGGGTCNAAVITQQPVSATLIGPNVTLSVSATGDAPLAYQWFIGAKGITDNPVGTANGPALTIAPKVTTTYWVRISNACSVVQSEPATVTVNGCPAVAITSLSASTAILRGGHVALSVAAAGGQISYQWYVGATGVTGSPIAGATGTSIDVAPYATTTYWVRATNGCGASIDSAPISIIVTPCDAPAIVVQPAGGDVLAGTTTQIAAIATGTETLRYQWYEGATGDTSKPVSNAGLSSMTTPALLGSTSYWLRVTNDCGSADTNAAPMNVVASCSTPVIVAQPRGVTVPVGTTATLTVAATGSSLTYQWYEGPILDFTHPVGGSSPTLITPIMTATTPFWVRISSPCGTASSLAATVIAEPTIRHRGAGH